MDGVALVEAQANGALKSRQVRQPYKPHKRRRRWRRLAAATTCHLAAWRGERRVRAAVVGNLRFIRSRLHFLVAK